MKRQWVSWLFWRLSFLRFPFHISLCILLLWFCSDANNAIEHLTSFGYEVKFGYKKAWPEVTGGNENNIDNNNPPPGASENKSPLTGQCTKCGIWAFRTCARCGDFYCSESCQVSDWHSHKRNCFEMPWVYIHTFYIYIHPRLIAIQYCRKIHVEFLIL